MTQTPAGNSRWKARGWILCGRGGRGWKRDFRRRNRAGKCHDSGNWVSVQAAWLVPLPSRTGSSLPALSRDESDLAAQVAGRRERGQFLSDLELLGSCERERVSIGEAVHAQCVPSVGGVVQGKWPA